MSKINKSSIEIIFESIKTEVRKLDGFRKRKEWFDFLLYLAVVICVLFSPFGGILSGPLEEFFDSAEFIDIGYASAFGLLIFILCFIFFILKSVEIIKDFRKTIRLFLTVALSFLLVVTLNSLSSQIRFSPDFRENQISWGEEALVLKDRPESVIYDNNKDALENSKGLWNQPFEVGASLPISRQKGIDDSEEILRGIAVAQNSWNNSHPKVQMVVAITDDGYDNPENEIPAAQKASDTILGYRRILGVIGHFTSDATEAVDEKYAAEDVVLLTG